MTPAPPTPPARHRPAATGPRPTDQTIRETIESIIIAFALAFVFRAYVVEAFVIPTGSMAPTLLGQHLRTDCRQCGHGIKVDMSDQARAGLNTTLTCPMCFYPNPIPAEQRTSAGDRILVQKYIYPLSEPRRYDVIVFKNPRLRSPGPRQNYIKRLIGLPGEQLAIVDGNIHTRPLTGGPWRIARKTDPAANSQWQRIQRAVWQPIYHSRHVPLDAGTESSARRHHIWRQPWQPSSGTWRIDRGRFTFEGSTPTPRSPTATGTPGRLRFNFKPPPGSDHGHGLPIARYPYDQTNAGFEELGPHSYFGRMRHPDRAPWDAIEDIRLAVTMQPTDTPTTLRLRSTARLAGGPEPISATLTPDGRITLATASGPVREPVRTKPPAPGQATRIELWIVDQELLVWRDGRCVLRHTIDLTWHQVLNRPAPAPLPQVAIEAVGGAVTLMDIDLDRDLYYGTFNAAGRSAHGGYFRDQPDSPADGEPIDLHADEFFVIGDNGPISEDGRYWDITVGGVDDLHPWIEQRMFADDGRRHTGRVPRRLILGRAFFVYYPAPFPLSPRTHPEASGVFPNFGEMRMIH